MNANPRYIEHGMGDFNPPDDGMREARGWMRTGELMSSAEWVRDTIGLIAERHWMAIADQRAPLSPLAAAPVLPPVAQPLERAAAGTSSEPST